LCEDLLSRERCLSDLLECKGAYPALLAITKPSLNYTMALRWRGGDGRLASNTALVLLRLLIVTDIARFRMGGVSVITVAMEMHTLSTAAADLAMAALLAYVTSIRAWTSGITGWGCCIHDLASVDCDLEELRNLLKGSLKELGRTKKAQEVLTVEDLLCDHCVWLAVGANTHVACVNSHTLQKTHNSRLSPSWQWSVEAEVLDVCRDQIDLCLEVVAEANNFGTALL